MKKVLGLLACILLLASCDDGDVVLKSFNFDTVSIQKCTDKDILFKTNQNELLLVSLPASFFPNEATPADQPRIVSISEINKVLYRQYSGNVDNGTVCSAIPQATPVVQNEWKAAAGGTIQIISTPKTTLDTTTNQEVIVGYNHQIKFLNVLFVNGSDSFVFEEYLFGTYTTVL